MEFLRAVALSYPMLEPLAPVPAFTPAAELAAAGRLPILLTRVGLEFPQLATAQGQFIGAAHSQHAI